MSTKKSPRKGSLQFWPRKRINKFCPRVNWNAIPSDEGTLKGFICYKKSMVSAYVKENTPNSMTKNKKIVIPVTILECPPLKILSVRFYKNNQVAKEILAENVDKELKRKIKISKKKIGKIEDIKSEEFDDIRILCYSLVKKIGLKKTPDISEFGLFGTSEEKFNFVKNNLGKEILISDVFKKNCLIDVRGLTKGKGLCGPVKRFGLHLKQHKSEKGQRRPGSLGPWHPARVTFRAPMAGQLGMFTRISYNSKIIEIVNKENKDKIKNIPNSLQNLKSDYLIVRGSVQGPSKRQLLITSPLRQTKKQAKKTYEFIELR